MISISNSQAEYAISFPIYNSKIQSVKDIVVIDENIVFIIFAHNKDVHRATVHRIWKEKMRQQKFGNPEAL